MKVTYYGHSCFMMEIKNRQILFDPFITPNELAKDIDVSRIKPDYILVSHGHIDHIADAIDIASASGAMVVSNFEIITWFETKGIKNGHPMNIGGSWNFDFGRLKLVNAVHSSVLPDGTYGGNPYGFLIESSEANIYYAGDTALTLDMQLIARTTNVDYAFLPIGDNFTMGIDDAVQAAQFVKCDKVIAMHYDTMDLIKIDREEAKKKFRNAECKLIMMDIGEEKEL